MKAPWSDGMWVALPFSKGESYHEKNIKKAQLRDILQNIWPVLLEIVKVINKGDVRHWHSQEEPKEPHALVQCGFLDGILEQKRIVRKHSEIQIRCGVQLLLSLHIWWCFLAVTNVPSLMEDMTTKKTELCGNFLTFCQSESILKNMILKNRQLW